MKMDILLVMGKVDLGNSEQYLIHLIHEGLHMGILAS